MDLRRWRSVSLLTGLGLWAASLALYVLTLAPGLSWGVDDGAVDGGELLAAARVLGVPHPPGYPTYTLLLRLFTDAVPVGSVAYRGNLMSAVAGALAVAVLYWALLRVCRYLLPDAPPRFAAASAALGAGVFATSPLFWSQAIVTEVYTLNALFAAALLLLAVYLALDLPWMEGRPPVGERTAAALMAFLLGLGLGNHLTLLAVAVPLVYWVGAERGWRRLTSPWTLGALLAGLAVYAYLPLRAMADPPINWGDPDDLVGFLWTVSGRPYQTYVFGAPAALLPTRLADVLDLTFGQFNPLGIFLGLVGGAVPLRLGAPRLFWGSLASIVVLYGYALLYQPLDFEVLLIPAFLLFSAWLGVGFYWVLSLWTRYLLDQGGERGLVGRWLVRYPATLLVAVAFLALPATAVALNYNPLKGAGGAQGETYGRELMAAVPDGSVVLGRRERAVFSLWYMRWVEEPERDVAPVAIPLLQFPWYVEDLKRRWPDRVPPDLPTETAGALDRLVSHAPGRVYFTYADSYLRERFLLEEAGPVYRAFPR